MKKLSTAAFRTARRPHYWQEMRTLLGVGSWLAILRNLVLFLVTLAILYAFGYRQIVREETILGLSALGALAIWILVAHFISLERASAILWLETRESIPDQRSDIVGELPISVIDSEVGIDGRSFFRIRNEHLTQSICDCYVVLNEFVPIEFVGEGLEVERKTRDQYYPVFGMLHWLNENVELERIKLDPNEMGSALFASVAPGTHAFQLEFYGSDDFSDYHWRRWSVLGHYELYGTVFGKLTSEEKFRSYEFVATINIRDYPTECEIELEMVRKLREGQGSWWTRRRYTERSGRSEIAPKAA